MLNTFALCIGCGHVLSIPALHKKKINIKFSANKVYFKVKNTKTK